jgi:hypothetical protein
MSYPTGIYNPIYYLTFPNSITHSNYTIELITSHLDTLVHHYESFKPNVSPSVPWVYNPSYDPQVPHSHNHTHAPAS